MSQKKAEKELNTKPTEGQNWVYQTPIRWDRETDVLVVGSGSAGLSAAVEAVNAAAKVLILEKYEDLGGASAGCAIYNAYDSKLGLHRKMGIKDSPELFYEDTMKSGEYKADPELVRTMVEGSPDAINFMIDHGCEFEDELRPGEGTVARRFKLKKSGSLPGRLFSYVQNNGGEIMLNTRLTDLFREGYLRGRVVGARAVSKDGKEINIKAKKAVILATGIWNADEKMVLKEWPTVPKEVLEITKAFGALGLPFGPWTGEAIRIAERIGAATRHMNYISVHPYKSRLEYLKKGIAVAGLTRIPFEVHINLEGKRFHDESQLRGAMGDDVLKQPEATYFVIEDSNLLPKYKMPWVWDHLDIWLKEGYVFRTNTIQELANRLEKTYRVPANEIVKTVDEYNRYCETGLDQKFAKPREFLLKLDKPPFYSGPPYTASIEETNGGLHADVKAQVLDREGEVIPNLYAAGTCVGGHIGSQIGGIMGNYQIDAVVFGRIAGQNAAFGT